MGFLSNLRVHNLCPCEYSLGPVSEIPMDHAGEYAKNRTLHDLFGIWDEFSPITIEFPRLLPSMASLAKLKNPN